MRTSRIAFAIAASFALMTPALAVDWNFYHHQSAPLFATSRPRCGGTQVSLAAPPLHAPP